MSSDSRHTQRSAATRRRLLDAARALFAERGYADVGTEEIVRVAGVTRGALYHQFADKAELLAAVAEELDAEVSQQIATGAMASVASDPVAALVAGADAFLQAVAEPAVHQILLVDALSVLGWARLREISFRYGLGMVEAAITAGIEAGALRPVPVRPLAHLLLGALDEAALYVVAAEDRDAARAEMLATVTVLIDGMRAA